MIHRAWFRNRSKRRLERYLAENPEQEAALRYWSAHPAQYVAETRKRWSWFRRAGYWLTSAWYRRACRMPPSETTWMLADSDARSQVTVRVQALFKEER